MILTILAKLANIWDMKTVSIHDAKTNLSKYIAAAKKGEKIYIGGFGKAEVLLVKVSDEDKSGLKARNFAAGKNKVQAKAGAFAPATDEAIANLMLGD
jgi:antitoxin (DNA-binding transcriptional repressor) of toxin-antitoxin stability system